jgi:hypothetical protein
MAIFRSMVDHSKLRIVRAPGPVEPQRITLCCGVADPCGSPVAGDPPAATPAACNTRDLKS